MNEMITTTEMTPIEIALQIDAKGMTTARKLYSYLELNKSQFSRWAKINILDNAYAEENVDYIGFDINVEGNQVKDYKLSADFAKKLSMVSKSKNGEAARNYFVTIENKLKQISLQKKDSYLIEDRIERAKRWIEEAEYTRSLEVKNAELDADNKKLKPAATYAMNVLHHNKNLTSIDAVGRELGLNKNSMHKLLRDVKILCKCGSKYVLAAGHEDLGKGKKEYFLEKTYEQKGRKYPIQNSLAVTEKGRGYIIKNFDEWKIKAYGDQWREHLWSKAQLDKYYKSISE